MRTLAVGDVCGSIGVKMLARVLPRIRREKNIDFVIVNGENSADGNGITQESAEALFLAGADVITGGNHSFRRKEVYSMLESHPFLLCPNNIPSEYGKGYCLFDMGRTVLAVINLSGKIYLDLLKAENPFYAADSLVERAKSEGATHIFVDFHAEATSEKRALGLYLDGKITAFFGTHTHVQTADLQILEKGTGYITDLGMTGPINSVLGVESSIIINRLKDGDATKFTLAEGKCMLCGCIFESDSSGRTVGTELVCIKEGEA
ncbi:MAG: TIGR00282 family metallophosphoesterase [Ruminococcaceae bacterium]|nr:TIGR00282 family metallophosphoesterase [Oscillospiraceae bacterium]